MHHRLSFALLLVAFALPPPVSADLAKLDRRARVALGALREGQDAGRRPPRGPSLDENGALDVFIVGRVGVAALEAAGARVRTVVPGHCTASLPAEAVEAVAALPDVVAIRGAAPLELELDASASSVGVAALRGAGPAFAGANGAGVLIGCVDSGVDFDHGDFQTPSGATRLVGLWDQRATGGPAPSGFSYGTAWTPSQIDAGLCTQIDQEAHGTHVLGIAGGDGSQSGTAPAFTFAGIAPRADLAMVRSNYTETGIVDGVRYLFDLAGARGQSAVVNISLGGHFGPHDGTSPLEAMLSAMTGPGRIVVKSAGNDRGSLRHAEVRAATGLTATMAVTATPSHASLTVFGIYESTENLSLRVRTPAGVEIGPVARGDVVDGVATVNGLVYVENGERTSGGGDYEVLVQIDVPSGPSSAINGEWSLIFDPVQLGAAGGEVDLWRADATVTGLWLAGAQAEELVSEPGNAAAVITVGAYVTKKSWVDCNGIATGYGSNPTLGSLATFSSPGPTRDGRIKPDLTAPGQGIASTTDFDVFPFCGTNSAYVDGLHHKVDQGTSMSAPHVAGAIALLLQSHGPLTPAQALSRLAAVAQVDAFTGTVPNNDWGHGKLFLDATVPVWGELFHAAVVSEGVEVRAWLGPGLAAAAWHLERAPAPEGPWSGVEAERRNEGEGLVALDRSPLAAGVYYYRIALRDQVGATRVLGPIRVDVGAFGTDAVLEAPTPNPSRGHVRVEFALPRPTAARITVHDLQGRTIAVLAEGPHRAGRYRASFEASRSERPVPAGLYFVSLQTGTQRQTRRLVMAP